MVYVLGKFGIAKVHPCGSPASSSLRRLFVDFRISTTLETLLLQHDEGVRFMTQTRRDERQSLS